MTTETAVYYAEYDIAGIVALAVFMCLYAVIDTKIRKWWKGRK